MDPTRKISDPLEKISVSRKMYLAGFALLPWFWFVNYLMFRKELLKPTVPHELKVCTLRPSALIERLSLYVVYPTCSPFQSH